MYMYQILRILESGPSGVVHLNDNEVFEFGMGSIHEDLEVSLLTLLSLFQHLVRGGACHVY